MFRVHEIYRSSSLFSSICCRRILSFVSSLRCFDILDNAAKSGLELIDRIGDKVFDFTYWRDERWLIAFL